mmetsp:Transcript_27764/g.88118  ORF Transcript_27764/g.88118 Transcript_27764/m.88118 type:complete len:282 (+) Transcript_27764:355-1200(+)
MQELDPRISTIRVARAGILGPTELLLRLADDFFGVQLAGLRTPESLRQRAQKLLHGLLRVARRQLAPRGSIRARVGPAGVHGFDKRIHVLEHILDIGAAKVHRARCCPPHLGVHGDVTLGRGGLGGWRRLWSRVRLRGGLRLGVRARLRAALRRRAGLSRRAGCGLRVRFGVRVLARVRGRLRFRVRPRARPRVRLRFRVRLRLRVRDQLRARHRIRVRARTGDGGGRRRRRRGLGRAGRHEARGAVVSRDVLQDHRREHVLLDPESGVGAEPRGDHERRV